MRMSNTIVIGTGIWGLGVSAYMASFLIPMMQDTALQANLVLLFSVIPLIFYGTKLYYKNGGILKGIYVGSIFFAVAAVLDALITVPFLVIPNGGNYIDFFFDHAFWGIGLLFLLIPTLYWYRNVKRNSEFIQSIKKS